jgi:uncharacterized protein (TIGR02594 family)
MNPRRLQPSDPPHLKRAFADLGLKEIVGPRHNARVLEMFKKSGFPGIKNDETAWCAAAVGCWLVEAGLTPSGSLMARSYKNFGIRLNLSRPIPRGAIGVIPRTGDPNSGHVFLVLEDADDYITYLAGNDGNAVSIRRIPRRRLISATWPADLPLPGKPVSLIPQPPDIEPVEDVEPVPTPKTPWWKRLWAQVTGGASGVGLLAYLTDPWVILALAAVVLVGVILFVWWMDPDRVRAWVSRKFESEES